MSKVILQAINIQKGYGKGTNSLQVLQGVNLEARQGEMTAIIGASGSGKTTLLQILGTLDRADKGDLRFAGRSLNKASDSALSRHRNGNIGFIFQFHHLLPEFSALENVMMPGLIGRHPRHELQRNAEHLLEQVGLKDRLGHRPGELSGGEQQRVALARALILQPALLLADEPTGNLDTTSGQKVFSLLQKLSHTLKLSVVMVTHNLELAAQMDNTHTLTDGRLA